MIKIAVNAGENDGISIVDRKKDIEKFIGDEIVVEEPPISLFHENLLKGIQTKKAAYDVCAYAPLWAQDIAQEKHLFDLNQYVMNKDLTWKETKEGLEGDFFKAYINYCGWHDMNRKIPGRGQGEKLIALPGTHTGATFLVYRKDIFEKYGLKEPSDWEEFQKIALEYADIKNGLYGTAIAGKRKGLFPVLDWYTRVVSTGGRQFSGSIVDHNLTSTAYSEEGVRAYEQICLLLSCMPKITRSFTVHDVAEKMCNGELLMQLNVSSFVFPQIYYRKSNKVCPEQLGICQVPGLGKYKGVAYGGGWSWAILNDVREKETSWKIIQYLSSKEFDPFRCMKYGVTPVRKSTARNPKVQKMQPWVQYIEPIIEKAVEPEYFYIPEAFSIAAIITDKLLNGIFRGEKAKWVLKEIDEDVNRVLRNGGWQ